MQRRAVAVYVALFLLIGAASYTLMVTAEQPQISVEDPDYQLSSGEEFTAAGQSYTAATVEEVTEEGSYGSTSTYIAATVEWTLTGVENTDEWAEGDTITVDEREWEVTDIAPPRVTVEEVLDRQAILEADPDADNQTYSGEDGEFVRINGETVPASEYFDPAVVTFTEGETVPYDGQSATLDSVTNESVAVSWTTTESRSQELQSGDTITLADNSTYTAYFTGTNTLELTDDTEAYQASVAEQETFSQRVSGLRWVTFTTAFISFLMIAFAFLPSRY
ncbi:hypothetical protein EGH24_04415 [Halonotius terrestris]|uniref:Uncharacterized protein n=1 Tax=Halonotius terrestris TaxID=2487750 RepID=A0A8J8TCS4_9EURY|nr:hypothetical protein [Halonotius terrestris]TQQ82698.1 hypothetical protein EGH24_04415 [Halonotius terrestris]